MGKSPGKWIKAVLFGKKSSKSSFPKNGAIGKKTSSDAKAPSGDLPVDPPVNVDLPPQTTNRSAEITTLEGGTEGGAILFHGNQGAGTEGAVGLNSENNSEILRQEQAATKAQATFRGYMARRAFRALKGIIRLQALIRGHLVRRQAVATLRSMQAIVKFQALVRGRRVRLSHAGCEVLQKCRSAVAMRKMLDALAVNTFPRSEKLSRNAFVIKLVAWSPSTKPLSLQYDLVEPNSVWSWLERWSSSRFWEPLARPKKSLKSKHQKKQANMQSIEREPGRSKRAAQRVPTSNGDSSSLHSSSENEKSKRTQRKALSHQTESVQEHPQNELERVKRSLRKVSVSAEEASDKPEAVTEKRQRGPKKGSSSPAPDVSKKGMDSSSEKMSDPTVDVSALGMVNLSEKTSDPSVDVTKHGVDNSSEKTSDPTVEVSEQPVVEPPPKALEVDKPVEMLHDDHPAVELVSSESGEKFISSDKVNEELSPKEDQTKESQRTRRRRSFPVKQEYPENVSQNTPTLPSYMAATESAKAKLRAQGSPRLGQDEAENGFVRRHSLPSSANGKLSSLSPRVQRSVAQANGKGGSRNDRSLLSSRDGNEKVLQPGWRR